MHAVFNRRVQFKNQLRRIAKLHAPPQIVADKARRRLERLHHRRAFFFFIDAHIDLRIPKVARHFHMLDGKHAVRPRVGNILADDLLRFAHDFAGNAVCALKLLICHIFYSLL